MEVSEINKKQKAILEKSRELFWKFGFRRVTVGEICLEANVSKMTFYRFYPNKMELAKAVLDQFYTESVESFRKIMREDTPVSEKMKKLIQLKFDGTNDISDEFIHDFYTDVDNELTAFIEERIKYIWTESIKDFRLGQQNGWIRKNLNVEFLFYFSQKLIPALKDKELMKLFNSPQELVMEMANLFVYGIIPEK